MSLRLQLINDHVYHIITRGVRGSLLFKSEDDYYRYIFSLYSFNDDRPIEIRRERDLAKEVRGGPSSATSVPRDCLVEILAFCIMPNHIHLLLRQIKNNGIVIFIRKLGTGYAGYFNRKYERKGYVFQGRFQSIHIENDVQLKAIFNYIHTNPVSLIKSEWKTKKVKNLKTVIKFIEDYKWSSYGDYIGKEHFPSLTRRDFILNVMSNTENCQESVNDWVKNRKLDTK